MDPMHLPSIFVPIKALHFDGSIMVTVAQRANRYGKHSPGGIQGVFDHFCLMGYSESEGQRELSM